jgi:hypothetical protein
MAAVDPGERATIAIQTALLAVLYLFLYFPILYVTYLSFMENSVWPFPPIFTWDWYERLGIMSDFHVGLWNSFLIGIGTAALSALFATTAAMGILRYPVRHRGWMAGIYLAPLFVAQILIGISTLMFNRNVLDIPGNIESAIMANTSYSLSFAFLVILAQLTRYDWRLDEVAQVFGARPIPGRGGSGVRRPPDPLFRGGDLSQHLAGDAGRLSGELHPRLQPCRPSPGAPCATASSRSSMPSPPSSMRWCSRSCSSSIF